MWEEIKRVQCGKKEELLDGEDDQQYEVQQCSVENKLTQGNWREDLKCIINFGVINYNRLPCCR